MRKWMRERLTRRKKKAPDQGAQPAPPPLQPAYFDAEPSSTAAIDEEASASEPVRRRSSQHESGQHESSQHESAGSESLDSEDTSPDADSESQSSGEESIASGPVGQTAAPSGSGPARRGRRRRGGRGRGGRGREQAVAQAFTPAVAKGIIPETDAAHLAEGSSDREPEAAVAAAEAPQLPAASAPTRAPKGIVVLAIGLPGSGKSSWFKRHNVVPLSSDMVRSLLFDDVREQRFQDLVFSNLRAMLKARLIAKRPMNYVDATNLTPQERAHWVKLAKDYNYEVHAVFFDVPLEVCVERHQRRDRVVPEDVMRRMAAKLKPPSFAEGFAKITVVRVKKKEE
jgi:predicted kinase